MFDLIITGATIIDGTGRPSFPGEIGIRDDRIAEVGESLGRARKRIRARGKMVAPGFIDIHSHSDYHLLVNPRAESKVRQGVTTEVGGNCGYSAAPLSGEVARERLKSFPSSFGLKHPWRTVSEYFHYLEDSGISINFALLGGHNTIRAAVMGGDPGTPGSRELRKILTLTEEALEAGAIGLSTGLAYAPACFSGKRELMELGKLARKWDVIFAAHIRSEGKGLLEALDEFLEVGKETGASLEVSHLKTMWEENWGKLDAAFGKIENYIRKGYPVSADRYPYTAANTGLSSILPQWALAGDSREIRARLTSPRTFGRLVEEIDTSHDERYWQGVIISQAQRKVNQKWEGKSVWAACRGKQPAEFALRLLKNDYLYTSIHIQAMSEKNLERILAKPWVMIGSDSAVRSVRGPLRQGKPHPRAFGTFPRILGNYVRGEKLLSLPRAVHKMTGMPARKLGLKDRGIIKAGNFADLVIFSPDLISDRSTYPDPYRYPTGIDYVIINGQVVIEEGRHTGARAGRVLRKVSSKQ
ncbi:MAG: D-aminoacylase [Proteobacteria bacterium]|nr:D-aminoacylase [Pseudomonadota bacterium]